MKKLSIVLVFLFLQFIFLFSQDNMIVINCTDYGVDQLDGQIIFRAKEQSFGSSTVAALDRAGKFHYYVLGEEGEVESYTYLSTPDRNIICDNRFATLYDYGDRIRFQTLNMIGAGSGSVWYKPLNFEILDDGSVDTLSQSPPKRPYTNGLLVGSSDNDSISRFYSYIEHGEQGIEIISVSYDMAGGWDGDTTHYSYGPESEGMVLMDINQSEVDIFAADQPELLMSSYYIPQVITSEYMVELQEIDEKQSTVRRKTFTALELGFDDGDKFVARKVVPYYEGYLIAGYRYDATNIKLSLNVVHLANNWEYVREYSYPPEYMFRDLEMHYSEFF